jgi:two-component system, response regulator / RNA-binding antiterminator
MLRVTVVDESNQYDDLLREGLRDSGHTVVAALNSTIDILEQVEHTQLDVIVISMDPPGRDSLEHICVINQNRPKPIVMSRQERNSDTMQAAVHAGVTVYIVDGRFHYEQTRHSN